MRAAALDYEHRRVLELHVERPCLATDDQVLFRVREVGICGTDRELATFEKGFPPEGESFLIPGHEALGQVIETGPAVKGLRKGDWVVPMIRRPCSPACISCARGRRDLCVSGKTLERGIFGLHGYFSDYAVDAESDLVRVPEDVVDYAVLVEPLSVVEKAIEAALRYHEPGPRTALILGAGPIGLLAGLALQVRGLETSIFSMEPADHPRANLATAAGLRYLSTAESASADIVVEATGSPEATLFGLHCLAPLGVYAVVGGANVTGEFRFMDLLFRNQVVFGTVNASPQAFALALEDLRRFDSVILARMICRVPFSAFRESAASPGPGAPKTVHVLAN